METWNGELKVCCAIRMPHAKCYSGRIRGLALGRRRQLLSWQHFLSAFVDFNFFLVAFWSLKTFWSELCQSLNERYNNFNFPKFLIGAFEYNLMLLLLLLLFNNCYLTSSSAEVTSHISIYLSHVCTWHLIQILQFMYSFTSNDDVLIFVL